MRLNNIFRSIIGSQAQEYRLNVIANNISNVNTPGFKKDVPIFRDFMVKATKSDFSQGFLRKTGGSFDLALNGPGFFQIETPFGTRYTRNGSFVLNSEGSLVTKDGYPVKGELTIPRDAREVTIVPTGNVLVDRQNVGTIEIVEFEDLNVLKKEGNNFFVLRNPQVTGNPAEETTVEQGYLEMSNVNAVNSMINLIDTTRTYEAFQKVIHSCEETDSKIINDVGRLM
ncbi:MAG: flagellar hook basal-body protein [Deltaproteobacteria bacterium]|nr:flagellar hook basal-body protein [Deltaproteobacteria bacterium]MBW2141022.1 flagellar hook basal-body protein [Deltaproteobacteria bacterium]MBW2322972.1 flagellar hook basal-body protein [Deltaproteobacteria bacterium]